MNLDDYVAPALSPNIIQLTPTRLQEWCETCALAFEKPVEIETYRLLLQDTTCLFYAYEIDGAIVSTLLMNFQENNAGIHEVATLPEYRGRGFSTALLHRAFSDAKDMNYPLVSLQASIQGQPIYRRIGMRVVSKIANYRFP